MCTTDHVTTSWTGFSWQASIFLYNVYVVFIIREGLLSNSSLSVGARKINLAYTFTSYQYFSAQYLPDTLQPGRPTRLHCIWFKVMSQDIRPALVERRPKHRIKPLTSSCGLSSLDHHAEPLSEESTLLGNIQLMMPCFFLLWIRKKVQKQVSFLFDPGFFLSPST